MTTTTVTKTAVIVDQPNQRERSGSAQTTIFAKLLHEPAESGGSAAAWVIGMVILDKKPTLQQVKDLVMTRIVSKYSRFRSIVVLDDKLQSSLIEVGVQDMDYHFPDLSSLPPKSRLELNQFVGELNEFKYDLTKPLFRYLLVSLEHGQCALISCINHALGDGLALMQVCESLYDDVDDVPPIVVAPKTKSNKKPTMDLASRAGLFLYGIYYGLTLSLTRADPPNPLRLKPGMKPHGKKRIALANPIPLSRVKEIKSKLEGSTVNDVLMGVMAMTLKSAFPPSHRGKITAQFPMSLRKRGETGLCPRTGEPHNNVAYAFYDFDLRGTRVDMVWSTKHQIDLLKLSPCPLVTNFTTQLGVKFLPHRVMMDVVREVGNLGTAQLSNVPAPSHQVSMLNGIKCLDMSFFLFSPLACYLGILTYNGQVNCAFNLDSGLDLDPQVFATHWNEEFELLYGEVMGKKAEELVEPEQDTAFYRLVCYAFLALVLSVVFKVVLF